MLVSKGNMGLNRRGTATSLAALSALAWSVVAAHAVVVELKDVAPDRVERQRAEAIGQIPLPGTPNIGQLKERLASKKLAVGNAIMIRIFKAESELELWMQRGDKFELFAVYPMCNWSGTLGPKVTEGDKQSPEGVYTVTSKQLHLIGRHPRSLNLGFPNALDRQFSRTGSYILIHGGCGTTGCFAMTNPVIEEIFSLSQAAIKNGQEAVQVHAFPFRMTEDRLKAHALSEWYDFWRNLKDVHDSFDRTRRPPRVSVCEGRYWVEDTLGNGEVASSHGPLAVCGASLAAVDSSNSEMESVTTTSLTNSSPRAGPWSLLPPASTEPSVFPTVRQIVPSPNQPRSFSTGASLTSNSSRKSSESANVKSGRVASSGKVAVRPIVPASSTIIARVLISCNETRPSCRKWVELQTEVATRKIPLAKAVRLVVERRPNARVIVQR